MPKASIQVKQYLPFSCYLQVFSHFSLPVAPERLPGELSFVWKKDVCIRKMSKIPSGLPNLRFTPVISETWKACIRFPVGPRGRITSVLSPDSSWKLGSTISLKIMLKKMCLYNTYHLFFLLQIEMLRPLIQREVLKASGWDHRIVFLQGYFRMIVITWEMLQNNSPKHRKLKIVQ